jgi:chromosome segregation ATPase
MNSAEQKLAVLGEITKENKEKTEQNAHKLNSLEHTIVTLAADHKYLREDVSRVETSIKAYAAETDSRLTDLQKVVVKIGIGLIIIGAAVDGGINLLAPLLGGL